MSGSRAGTLRRQSSRNDGPRMDESIEARVNAELQRSCYPAVREVRCQFDQGVLTLQGRVASYHEKQVAQTLIRQFLDDVAPIGNLVEVVPSEAAVWGG